MKTFSPRVCALLLPLVFLLHAGCAVNEGGINAYSNIEDPLIRGLLSTLDQVHQIYVPPTALSEVPLSQSTATPSASLIFNSRCQEGSSPVSCLPETFREHYAYLAADVRQSMAWIESIGLAAGNLATSNTFQSVPLVIDETEYEMVYAKENSRLTWQINHNNEIKFFLRADNLNVFIFRQDDGGFQTQFELGFQQIRDWSVVHRMEAIPCAPSYVRVPERLQLNLNFAGGLWQGKLMSYHPRWLYSGSAINCVTPDDNAIARNLYYDFAADLASLRSDVYLLPRSGVVGFNAQNFLSYGLPALCGGTLNCPGNQQGNPFCLVSEVPSFSWYNNCGSYALDLSQLQYTAFDNWLNPEAFYLSNLDLPTLP